MDNVGKFFAKKFGIPDINQLDAWATQITELYPSERIQKVLLSMLKHWFLKGLADDFDVKEFAKEVDLSEENALKVANALFDHFRRKY